MFLGLRRFRRQVFFCPAVFLTLVVIAGPSSRASSKPSAGGGEEWPEITPAERSLTRLEQDPEADAVVLTNDRNGKILRRGNDWVNVMDYHWRLKVLNDRGKQYGEVHLRAEKYSRISNIRARTVKADGTVVPVPPDQIFEKVLLQVGDSKYTEWVFNFPSVEPGAILEYRYDRYDNFLTFIDPWFFAGPVFTLQSRLTQVMPIEAVYMILCDLCSGAKPEVSNWHEGKSKGQMYTIELRNIPGYQEEELMPPERDVSPRMEEVLQSWKNVYWEPLGRQDKLFTDWASIAKYIGTTYQAAIKDGQQTLKPVVDGWLSGVTDPQEKIKTITRHVQRDFKYIEFRFVPLRPDPVATLLKNRGADNGEKAVLLMTALKTIGVESQVALVSGKHKGSVNPKFFSPSQFTHAVVALPQPGGTTAWIDPTVTYAPFGFMSWKDAGADALLLKGDQGELTTLPAKNELSVVRYKSMVRPRPDGKAEVETEAEFTGEYAIDMRDDLAPASEADRLTFLKEWLSDRRPGAVLQSQIIESLDEVDKPLRIKLAFEAPSLITKTEDLILVRGCVLNCTESNPVSRASRQYPFYVDRGWNREETVTLIPPTGMTAVQMPPAAMAKSSLASYSLSCMTQDDGAARCVRQFVARRNRWPADQYSSVRSMFDKIVEADRTTVAFQKAEAATAGGQ